MMTSSNIGYDPPTSPVFPPCGTTAIFYSSQYLRMADTSSFVLGFNINFDYPINFFVQSELKEESS